MTTIATRFSETVRHSISTKVGVKIWNFSSSIMPQGSILGANKIQPRICHFCRAEQKGVFWGPLALGTENGHGWELSSQISQLACQFIVLSVDIHCLRLPASAAERRPRFCQSVGPRRSRPIMQYIRAWRHNFCATSRRPLTSRLLLLILRSVLTLKPPRRHRSVEEKSWPLPGRAKWPSKYGKLRTRISSQ